LAPSSPWGTRVELRQVQRGAADDWGTCHARLGPATLAVFSRGAVQRAGTSQPRRHRALADARIVGRGYGPAAVHAVALSEVRRIAAEVDKRPGTCVATRDMTVALPMKRWQQLGIRLPTGAPLPASDSGGAAGVSETAALVSGATRHFLVNGNYDALLEYNCA